MLSVDAVAFGNCVVNMFDISILMQDDRNTSFDKIFLWLVFAWRRHGSHLDFHLEFQEFGKLLLLRLGSRIVAFGIDERHIEIGVSR